MKTRLLAIIALLFAVVAWGGCKKDQPEESAAEPEAAPEKVDKPQLAEKTGALKAGEEDDDEPPTGKRPLVKAKDRPGKVGRPGKDGARNGKAGPRKPKLRGAKRPDADGEPARPGPRVRPGQKDVRPAGRLRPGAGNPRGSARG